MATPRGGEGRTTDVAPVTRQAAEAAVGGGLVSAFGGWFGPGAPMPPVAPREEVVGRQFDYPFAVNLNFTPPRSEMSETGVSAATLRALADPGSGGLDILRLAIETRKDQMCAQEWTVIPRNVDGERPTDPALKKKGIEIARLLESPDNEHTWSAWLRMLLEDHFVLDGVAVLPSMRGKRPAFELIDSGTIKRLLDEQGRTPLWPLPAYQQILKGLPAIDYTSRELRYFVLNARTNRIYGLSRVEQVINTVNLGLRRSLHIAQYYTQGSVPDAITAVPETWTPKQIGEFQTYWDSLLEGNTAARRKMRFVPGGSTPVMLKEAILKDEFDEWLARVICYAFSLSPQALVKEVNRATAETSAEVAKDEGLEPTKLFVKSVVDALLVTVGAEGFELAWADEEITDPKIKAEVTSILVGSKPVIDQNEAREMWGLPAKTDAELAGMQPVAPPSPFGAPEGSQPPGARRLALPARGPKPGADPDAEPDPEKSPEAAKVAGRALRGVPAARLARRD